MTRTTPSTSGERQEDHPSSPSSAEQAALCPYCGMATPTGPTCAQCGGALDPLSIQATQNQMGPWFIHDAHNPHRPGCSYQTLRQLARRGRISPETVIRGPTTRQFWSMARNVRGVAHLLGECHNCHTPASEDEYMCRNCGAVFEAPTDRQLFGVGAVRLIPGQTPADVVARSVVSGEPDAQRHRAQGAVSSQRRSAAARRARGGAGDSVVVKSLKRRLNQHRQMITVSAAANVVLLAALLISGVSSRFSVRPLEGAAGERSTTNSVVNDASTEAASAPADAADASLSAHRRDELAKIRRLASSGQVEDLRAAEKLLIEFEKDAGSGEAFTGEIQQLQENIRRRLDAKSLEKFLPEEPN